MVEDAEFAVVALMPRTPVIVEVELQPVDSTIDHTPGQYVLLGDRDYGVPVRSYSVANAPRASGRISLLVTRVAGGQTSTWVHDRLAVGETVLVSGPYGTFVAGPSSLHRPVLCLAGGSGLAPIRALAERAVCGGAPESFTVLLSARTDADVMDADLFAEWNRQRPGFRFLRTLTRAPGRPPLGRVPDLLPTLFADLSGHEVFIAGAPGFVSACAQACRALGVCAGHLHTEEFFADPQPWTTSAPVGVLG